MVITLIAFFSWIIVQKSLHIFYLVVSWTEAIVGLKTNLILVQITLLKTAKIKIFILTMD